MRSPLDLGRTIRNARRTREIFTVLVRYGFQNAIEELNLDTLIQRGKNLFRRQPVDARVARLPQAVRLRKAMEELGPTFVKLGQVLSMRPDLVPPEWADEFRRLQDEVPPVPFKAVREALDREYRGRVDEMFQSVDSEPLAAASIAQVHRAVMRDGTSIVLKVLRPGVADVLESDMQILRFLAEFAEEHFTDLGYSPTDVVDQFSRELQREINLIEEGRATDRLRRDFEDNPHVSFPTVYWDLTTRNILALEEVHGVLLSKYKPGRFTDEQTHAVVRHGTDAIFRQCLETGFFHADPHPGNIIVRVDDGPGRADARTSDDGEEISAERALARTGGGPLAAVDGSRPRASDSVHIYFIDCGMTGNVDPQTAGQLADLVQAVLSSDLDGVIDIALSLGGADPALAEDRTIRADVWEFISRFENATLESLDMGDLLREFFEKIRRNRLKCPADIVFLIKSITTIESVGEWLMPSFDVVSHVRPHVERLVRRRYGIAALRRRLKRSLTGYADLLETLPGHVRGLLLSLRRNRVTVNLEHRGLDRLTHTIEHASGNVAHAVFLGALILGSSILILADTVTRERGWLSIIAMLGFAIAIVLAITRALGSRFQ